MFNETSLLMTDFFFFFQVLLDSMESFNSLVQLKVLIGFKRV